MDDFLKDILEGAKVELDEKLEKEREKLNDDPQNYMVSQADKLTHLDQFSKKEEIEPDEMMQAMLACSNQINTFISGCVEESKKSLSMQKAGTLPKNAAPIHLPASFRSLVWAASLVDIMIHTLTHPNSKDNTIRYFYYLDRVEDLRKMIGSLYEGVSMEKIGEEYYLKQGDAKK